MNPLKVDLLAHARDPSGQEVLIGVEVKSHLRVEDVRHWEERLQRFFEFFTDYVGRRLLGAVTGIRLADGVETYAIRRGFFVLVPSGDVVALANEPGFKPREFGQPPLAGPRP